MNIRFIQKDLNPEEEKLGGALKVCSQFCSFSETFEQNPEELKFEERQN